jgi:hypothetical protein
MVDGASKSGGGGLDLDYATAWSSGTGESLNMFIPNFRGGASTSGLSPDGEVARVLQSAGYPRRDAAELAASLPGYWGTQPPTGGPTYLGAVVVFLFVLGMFVLPGRAKWWVFGVSVFGLLLAWGRNAMWFTEAAFAVLPGYNKFRTVAMALAVLQWSVPFLGALVASGLWKGGAGKIPIPAGEAYGVTDISGKRFAKGVLWALGLTGGAALFFALCGGWIYDFGSATDGYFEGIPGLVDAIHGERAALLKADCWRSLIFVVLTAGLVWLCYSWRGKMTPARRLLMVGGISALVLSDLVPVDLRFLSHYDFHAPSQVKVTPDEADLEILADPEPGFRVMNTQDPFNEAYTSYFHRSVGGYSATKLARYQDVIDRYLSRHHPGVLAMLDTKYFIVTDPASGTRSVEPTGNALGAAWFVDDVAWVEGAAAELDALDKTDLRRTAVVDRRFENFIKPAPSVADGRIELVEYRPNYLKYESSAATETLAVFSEIYYDKGWTAYIDGAEAPYIRADYILRAMIVPAGDHTIEWRFRAPHFAAVEGVTLACSIMILVWLAAALLFGSRPPDKSLIRNS